MELYTIIAQIINFSILIFLLNKFLYKPVLKTMDKRRNDIKQKIEETEKKLEESDKLKDEYFEKLKEVEKENIILRKQALEEVKKFREVEIEKAKDEVLIKRNKFNDYLDLEQKNLLENFNENLSDLFVKYSNDILKILANSSLQSEIVNNFLSKINNLNQEKIDNINSLNSSNIIISSSSPLNDKEKKQISDFLLKKGFKFKDIEYKIDEKLILGLELKAKSYILSWNAKELTANFIANIDKMSEEKR